MALIASGVASGAAVAINIATELKHSAWAWIAVVLLTLAGAGVTVAFQRLDARESQAPDGNTTHNRISGNVTGPVVQARDIAGSVNFHDNRRNVNQRASASGNSSIQQAAGDITNDYRDPNKPH
jgi:hypothetical protein